jgi:ribosomal protein L4
MMAPWSSRMSAKGAAKATSTSEAPLSASFDAVASSSALVSAAASFQIGVRQKPMRGRAIERSIFGQQQARRRGTGRYRQGAGHQPQRVGRMALHLDADREKSPKVGL